MIVFLVELVIILLGFVAALLLFYHIPCLPREKAAADGLRISVVIPREMKQEHCLCC
jgi:hypothetical protein